MLFFKCDSFVDKLKTTVLGLKTQKGFSSHLFLSAPQHASFQLYTNEGRFVKKGTKNKWGGWKAPLRKLDSVWNLFAFFVFRCHHFHLPRHTTLTQCSLQTETSQKHDLDAGCQTAICHAWGELFVWDIKHAFGIYFPLVDDWLLH